MKLKIFLVVIICVNLNSIAQTNQEIAGVYLNRAERSYADKMLEKSIQYFDKAIKLMGDSTSSRVARLGMILNFEQKKFFIARSYSYDYFELAEKGTEEYEEMLELRVDIQEKIDQDIAEMKKIEQERLRKLAQARRLDSLRKSWQASSLKFDVEVDSISNFNINNVAVYKKDNAYGIMDDLGNVIEKANLYKHAISYDGFILLLSDKNKPTKVYCYNTNTKEGGLLPSVVSFNNSSTHYGKVMLPRSNGMFTAYPNNSTEVYIYNLQTKMFATIEDPKSLLKGLRKNDIIDNYNKDGQVKINKKWLFIGGNLGGGIYALYESKNRLYGFLNTSNGNVLSSEYYNYLGAKDGSFELIDNGKRFWMNEEGVRQEFNADKNGVYNGLTRIIRLENGKFRLVQNIDGEDYLVLGSDKLINQKAFISKHP